MKKLFKWTFVLCLFCIYPVALASTTSVLLIPENTNDKIGMYDPFDGTYLGDFAPDYSAGDPNQAIPGPDGNIYVVEALSQRISVFSRDGNYLYIYADISDGLNSFSGIASRGDTLFVCSGNPTSDFVARFDGPHSRLPDYIADGTWASDIFFLEDGRCLVSDFSTGSVQLRNSDGTFATQLFQTSGWTPFQIQTDPQLPGAYLNVDGWAGPITDFYLDGTILQTFAYIGTGIYRLGNGNLLISGGPWGGPYGIVELDATTGDTVEVERADVDGRYIELCDVDRSLMPYSQYYPGDANMANGIWPPAVIGSDVTYLVNFFRSIPANPACLLSGHYCAADVNGDCRVIGSDVTRLVNYFRGIATLSYCPDYPPLWLAPEDFSEEPPAGWPNCETPEE